MNIDLVTIILPIVVALIASSGFWTVIERRFKQNDMITAENRIRLDLLKGLAHDRIVCLSSLYIVRGSITKDEYENLMIYLYKPYKTLGGNGFSNRLISEIEKLPISKTTDQF